MEMRLLVCIISISICGQLVTCQQSDNVINRMRGNILRNLTRTHEYEDNIVTSSLDASFPIRMFYRGIRELYSRLLSGTGQRENGESLQTRIPDNIPFPCKTKGYRSRTIPTSVHQLRPGDIDIVAALGDSITSATAANSAAPWELLVENRGLSWCIGGQGTWRTHLTLPNILKEFNPKIFGYSLSDAYNVHRSAQFNVAENIATTSDMPYNAERLIKRMKLDTRVDMKNHWKLVTFMIGGNDFCSDICYQTNATQWINENQERNLIKTLRYLRDYLPRTIVNLVPSPLVSISFSFEKVRRPFLCTIVQPVECSCLFGPVYSKNREIYRQKERNFVKIMERVSYMPELHNNNFTVVYQPYFKEASVLLDGKNAETSMMAIDCVHFSQKGHAIAANGLWNNMMEKVGEKSLGLKPFMKQFKCPTMDEPYIFTNYNSNLR